MGGLAGSPVCHPRRDQGGRNALNADDEGGGRCDRAGSAGSSSRATGFAASRPYGRLCAARTVAYVPRQITFTSSSE